MFITEQSSHKRTNFVVLINFTTQKDITKLC